MSKPPVHFPSLVSPSTETNVVNPSALPSRLDHGAGSGTDRAWGFGSERDAMLSGVSGERTYGSPSSTTPLHVSLNQF